MNKRLCNLFTFLSILIFSFVLLLYLFTNNFIWFILAVVCAFVLSRLDIKKFGLWLFVVSFVIRLAFIVIADFPQIYDFETLLTASHMFAIGDFSFQEWWHFATWGYQTGFVIYQGILLKLFNSVFLLKFLNVLYSSLLVFFIYKLSLRVSDEKSARVVSFLYMLFPFYIFMDIILANHHLSCLLMYLGIWFLIKRDKKFYDYVVAGVLISFGNIIRPEGIIVVLSLLVYEFFLFDKKTWRNVVVRVCAFLIVYFAIGHLASFMVIKTGVNASGLANKEPLWKFILGFNYDSCGYYDDSDTQYLVSDEMKISIIKERAFGDLPRTGKLLLCKVDRFWLSSGLNFETGSYYNKEFKVMGLNIKFSSIADVVTDFNSCVHIFILMMFLLGMYVNRKVLSNECLFLTIMVVITFFVFLFIEIQPRYAYFIHVSLFILASLGVKYVNELCNRFRLSNQIIK